METIICMKWGTKFGPEYVNRLASMVRQNMNRPYRLVCFTENSEGVDPTVEIRPLPELDLEPDAPERGWRKLTIFQESLKDLGERALFLDLDVVILKPLDDFFDQPGDFQIINDWNLANYVGNSSVFRFRPGETPGVLDYFLKNREAVFREHRNEQAYLSWWMKEHGLLTYWPETWCRSFKRHCVRTFPLGYFVPPKHPGPETRILVFHGHPHPAAILTPWHSSSFLRATVPPKWFLREWEKAEAGAYR